MKEEEDASSKQEGDGKRRVKRSRESTIDEEAKSSPSKVDKIRSHKSKKSKSKDKGKRDRRSSSRSKSPSQSEGKKSFKSASSSGTSPRPALKSIVCVGDKPTTSFGGKESEKSPEDVSKHRVKKHKKKSSTHHDRSVQRDKSPSANAEDRKRISQDDEKGRDRRSDGRSRYRSRYDSEKRRHRSCTPSEVRLVLLLDKQKCESVSEDEFAEETQACATPQPNVCNKSQEDEICDEKPAESPPPPCKLARHDTQEDEHWLDVVAEQSLLMPPDHLLAICSQAVRAHRRHVALARMPWRDLLSDLTLNRHTPTHEADLHNNTRLSDIPLASNYLGSSTECCRSALDEETVIDDIPASRLLQEPIRRRLGGLVY